MGRRVREERQDALHLQERAGPAVDEDQRKRAGPPSADVLEVDARATGVGEEARDGVDALLDASPVELRPPSLRELAQERRGDAQAPRLTVFRLVRPARPREPLAEIRERRLRRLGAERCDQDCLFPLRAPSFRSGLPLSAQGCLRVFNTPGAREVAAGPPQRARTKSPI
jgi:hypothetical protein